MSTHATTAKRWTESDLDLLPIERNVRQRGLEVTRLDTFIDAAFAFALTLLVISFDAIPANYDEMIAAVKRIPGFLASFSVLMMFWLSHRRWSRRYGLESDRTVFLSLAVIFVMLVYVYPLRMVFEAMFWAWSDGYFTSHFQIGERAELRGMFLFYSIGSFVMAMLFCDLYRAAMSSKEALALNQVEQSATKSMIAGWLVMAFFGSVSIILALSLPDELLPLAGYVYFLILPVLMLVFRVSKAEIEEEQSHQ